MMKSDSFRKQALSLVVLFAAIAAMFVLATHLRKSPAQDQAEFIVQQLLSCSTSIEQAAEQDAAQAESAAASQGSEPGLTQLDGSALITYVNAQFGDIVTKDCLNQMLRNRLPTRITTLAGQYNDKLEAVDLTLKKQSGEAVCYTYTASFQTVTDHTAVATASGTITMVKEDDVWKASDLTLTVS